MTGTVGESVALEWYDGPLLEIAPVVFDDGDKLIEVTTLLCAIEGEPPWQRAVLRLSREDLQSMLDMLDGKPVADWQTR